MSKLELITTLTIAVSQFILSLFLISYTIENHYVDFPIHSENAVWIDCVYKIHESSYTPLINVYINEYCESAIHRSNNVSIHDNIYFFQYIDRFHIPFPILIGTLICVWSGIWHLIFSLPIEFHKQWYWMEHLLPTGMITVSLIYFTGQNNLNVLINYAVIMIMVTAFPTFYDRYQINSLSLFLLTYVYVLSNIILNMMFTINRSSSNIQWYVIVQFAVGISVFSPFPTIFLIEHLLQKKHHYCHSGICCTPARYVHYVYSGIIRSVYVVLLLFTVFTK